MRIWDWIRGLPGTRRKYQYSTVIKFIYMFEAREWAVVVSGVSTAGLTREAMIAYAVRELHNCFPMPKDASPIGHLWPGGSNKKFVLEFVFNGRVRSDGTQGWDVAYTFPNEQGIITTGPRFEYGRMHELAIIEFFREQLELADMEICSKILSRE